MFTWEGKMIAMKSIPPSLKPTKKKPKFIFMCNQGESRFWDHTFPEAEFAKDDIVHGSVDQNLKTSSFEEGGTGVGSQDSSSKICIS